MFDIMQFLISPAYAETAADTAAAVTNAPPGSAGSIGMSFLPLILIFGVFYVLLIRPQQRKLAEQDKMIKSLQRGDRVITAGGVYGKVVRLEGDEAVILEIADGVQIKVVRGTIASLAAKTEPVAAAKSDAKD